MSAGLLLLGFLDADSGLALLAAGLVVIGLGLGLLSTPISNTAVGDVPPDLAGTAAGVFKMSSMVGGALGIAILSAIARGISLNDVQPAMESAGLTPDQIDQAHRALVQSASFSDAISSLPGDLAQSVTEAAIDASSFGVARSMVVTGVLALLATSIVAWLWPRAGGSRREGEAG
jgi:hypothetical protein